MRTHPLLILCCALLTAGCHNQKRPAPIRGAIGDLDPANPSVPPPGLPEAALPATTTFIPRSLLSDPELAGQRSALLQTDAAFSALSQSQGIAAAFHYFMAGESTFLPQGGLPTHGRDNIRDLLLQGGEGQLTWVPQACEVARSGDLGFTWGLYEFRARDTQGNPRLSTGKYISVWRRQANGSWRVILDGGNSNPPAE